MSRRRGSALLVFLTLLSSAVVVLAGAPGPSHTSGKVPYVTADAPGPFPVAEWTAEWKDASRSRTIPVRIYYPGNGPGPFPVIIMSHGLGGSRDGYRYLGERWASRGYVSVHLQHAGSDSEVLRASHPLISMELAAADPANALNRPKDVTFALDTLTALNGKPGFPLRGKLDLQRVGVAGHSFGAYTALASAGRVLSLPGQGTLDLSDPRIKACVALSAPVRSKDRDCPGYGAVKVPCLHMTGTEDDSPIGGTPAALRRVPFDCISGPDEYLVIFQGGDHMVFSGRFRRSPKPTDALFQKLVLMATTAFWDAFLQDDPAARNWLAGGGFGLALGSHGTFEEKTGSVGRPRP